MLHSQQGSDLSQPVPGNITELLLVLPPIRSGLYCRSMLARDVCVSKSGLVPDTNEISLSSEVIPNRFVAVAPNAAESESPIAPMIPISPGLNFLTLEGLVDEGPYLVHDDDYVVVVIPGDEIGLIQPNEVAIRQDASTHSPDMSEG